jgi:WD40 repeat protein
LVNCVAISPDGKTLVSGSGGGTIKVWNLHTGELRHTLSGHSSWVECVAISADGKTLVSCGEHEIKVRRVR